MRTQPDLDGGEFQAPDLITIPAETTMTLKLIAYVQYMMFRVSQLRAPSLMKRLERAETYLLLRYERECNKC